jgi:hypothetical protein
VIVLRMFFYCITTIALLVKDDGNSSFRFLYFSFCIFISFFLSYPFYLSVLLLFLVPFLLSLHIIRVPTSIIFHYPAHIYICIYIYIYISPPFSYVPFSFLLFVQPIVSYPTSYPNSNLNYLYCMSPCYSIFTLGFHRVLRELAVIYM